MSKYVPESVRKGLREQTIKGEIKQPDLARLTAHFFEVAGGERQIAKMLFEEFVAAKEGSIVRQRILDMILRATRFANERTPPPDDLGQLSEEDLQRELDALMNQAGEGWGDDQEHQPGAGPLGEGTAEETAHGDPDPADSGPDPPARADHPAGDGRSGK